MSRHLFLVSLGSAACFCLLLNVGCVAVQNQQQGSVYQPAPGHEPIEQTVQTGGDEVEPTTEYWHIVQNPSGEGGLIAFHGRTCIGGGKCSAESMRLVLPGSRAIRRIEFYAHDDVGEQSGGKLEIVADGRRVIARAVDIKKAGFHHVVNKAFRAREVRFKALTNDEIVLDWIRVFE